MEESTETERFELSVPFRKHTLSKRAPSATRSRLPLLFDGGASRIRTGEKALQRPQFPTSLTPLKYSLTSIDETKDVVNYPDDLVRQSDQPHVYILGYRR